MTNRHEGGLLAGTRVGNLRVAEEIGHGAFSRVYRAQDELIGRPVALKVLRGLHPDGETLRMVQRELRVLGSLLSPHIVTLYGVHRDDDGAWMLELEFVDGATLGDRLREAGVLAPDETRHVLRGMLRGLETAHARDVVHRDVKPENVLIGKDGTVKLTDFGLGREVNEQTLSQSSKGGMVGTPYYMAPEILFGEAATARSDLWSVGVVAYRMVTGDRPFRGQTLVGLFNAITTGVYEPLPASVPADLAALVDGCLVRDPAGRAPSATVLLDLLGEERESGVVATDPERVVRPKPPPAAPTATLVGRDAPRALLRRRLEEAESGQGRVVVLTGPEGVGKTALLADLASEVRQRRGLVLDARLSPLDGVPRALFDGMRRLVDPEGSLPPAARVDLEAPSFGPTGPTLRRYLTEGGAAVAPEVVGALELLLRGAARGRPAVLLLDELQHCDADGGRLLQGLAARLQELPVLTLLAVRSKEGEHAHGDGGALYRLFAAEGVEALPLPPLDREQTGALAAHALGHRQLPSAFVRTLWERTEGIPLLVLEFVRHLRDEGTLQLDEKSVSVTSPLAMSSLPARFHDLVANRLEGLSAEDHELLEAAAVGGLVFHGEEVAAVLGQPLLGVLRALQRLGRQRALIRPERDAYRFDHAMLREAIYERLAPALRAVYHRLYAESLEARADLDDRDRERLGLHWLAAGDAARAAPHLEHAAIAAVERQEHLRAIDLATRAGLLAGDASDERLQAAGPALFRILGSLADVDRMDDARALLDRIGRAAATLGDEALAGAHVVWTEDLKAYSVGPSAVDADRLRTALRTVTDWRSEARGHYLLAMRRKHQGRLDEAIAALREAERIHVDHGSRRIRPTVLHEMGTIARERLAFGEARDRYREAARLCAEGFQPLNAAISKAMEGLATLDAGDPLEAARIHEAAQHELADAGSATLAACVRAYRSQALAAAGRYAEARRECDRALATLEASPASYAAAPAYLWGAHLAFAVGDRATGTQRLAAYEAAAAQAPDDAERALDRMQIALYRVVDGGDVRAVAAELADILAAVTQRRLSPRQRVVLGLACLEAWLFGCPCLDAPGLSALRDALPTVDPQGVEVAEALDAARAIEAGREDPEARARLARPFARGRRGERQDEHRAVARAILGEKEADLPPGEAVEVDPLPVWFRVGGSGLRPLPVSPSHQ